MHFATDRQGSFPAFLVNSTLEKNSGFHPDSKSGFHPAVFIQPIRHKTPKALYPMRCKTSNPIPEVSTESRLLLISSDKSLPVLNKSHKPVNRKKPKKSELKNNRKHASFKGSITHESKITGVKTNYPVLADYSHGIYLSIVHKMIDQLEICQEKWGRVFVVRLEMHQKFYTGNNKLVSRFICNFKKKILKEYGIREIGFQWAREHEIAKAQHYHLAVFLDGYKVKSSWKIHHIAKVTWEKIKVGNTMPYVRGKVSHDIRKGDAETKAEAIEHVSYLAKTRGKQYRDPQAKDYSTSRMTPKRKALA